MQTRIRMPLGAFVLGAVLATSTTSVRAQNTASPAPAQANARRVGRILGVFDENGQPLEGADVVDRIGGGAARTQRAGLVGMAEFRSQHDSSVVTIRKIGFADTTILVMVGAADTVPMQVFLRHVTAIEGVTVEAHEVEHLPFYLKDFEERLNDAKAIAAKTFTPAELRKSDGRRLYDVLLQKGVGQAAPRCGRVGIFINGVLFKPDPKTVIAGSAGIPDDFYVADFDAVVYYSGATMPMEFRVTGGGCGALLLYPRNKS